MGAHHELHVPTSDPYVPVPGLYDDDAKTDLVGYLPTLAAFRMRLSSTNWASDTYRFFPSSLIPNDFTGATAQDRSGAVVVKGMTYHRNIGIPGSYYPRLALSVFDPESSNWYINWDPVTQASPSAACQYGWYYDVPLGGLGSSHAARTTPYKSGYAVYRSHDATYGTTYFRDANGVCGGGTAYNYTHTFGRPGSTSAVVRDMTNDQLPEVLIVDPVTMGIHVLTSQSHYQNSTYGGQTVPVVTMSNHLATIL